MTKLPFASALRFREDLAQGDDRQVNMYRSWRSTLSGKTFYIIGQSDSAYAITPELGAYNFEYISGNPLDLFEVIDPPAPSTREAPPQSDALPSPQQREEIR